MRLSFKGKSAIVTGACGGMGFETTKKLLKNNIVTNKVWENMIKKFITKRK